MYIPFVAIENDNQAEDLIQAIHEAEAETKRLQDICDYEIEKYTQKKQEYAIQHEDNIKNAMAMLGEYCRLKGSTKAKTQQTYKLPSGTLKWLKGAPRPIRDDSLLLDWRKVVAPEYVKTKTTESPDWSGLKKTLIECGDHYEYAIPDGELVPVEGVVLEPQEDTFEIK
jgi:phage host-nuclease inhibitor protein Gam